MRENWDLFLTFARISASCFGGGYAMLPFFQRELVSKKGWLTDEELLDLNAVAQCTPGVIAVNTATFCGYRVHGLSGSLLATLGVLVPPMIIVTIISAFFWSFAENPWVQHALTGVRACVCALIINSTIRLYRKASWWWAPVCSVWRITASERSALYDRPAAPPVLGVFSGGPVLHGRRDGHGSLPV